MQSKLSKLKLSTIAPIVNLILEGCHDGHFNQVYLQPRYIAGLAMQLFSCLLRGNIQMPDGNRYRANVQVLHVDNQFAGFVIVRNIGPTHGEIYMTSVTHNFRASGHGAWMLRRVLNQLPSGYCLGATCMPNSSKIKVMLPQIGFSKTKVERSGIAHFLYIQP